ncbi:hypothetical protein [Roseiconus lacunae]|uniref:Uncharacterized protein n=1 Tax=Roseiconus lacunae TaxID=2605694 RepID=A0ABT7PLX9_9BACT|nr:hypothetical protein [Roseiconus lacunae]MDM4017333.1 hypothetical protein [Roseiconus lacunae]
MTDEIVRNRLEMQPTFRVQLPWQMDETKRRIRAAVRSQEMAPFAETAGTVVDFKVDPSERRFWSPHLSIQLNPSDSQKSTEAFCRFSPRPEIWTMVMAVYLMAACTMFGALIYGLVQWMMKDPPWAIAVVPVSLGVITGLHLVSVVGQNWSRDQMVVLKHRWERTLELAKRSEPDSDHLTD